MLEVGILCLTKILTLKYNITDIFQINFNILQKYSLTWFVSNECLPRHQVIARYCEMMLSMGYYKGLNVFSRWSIDMHYIPEQFSGDLLPIIRPRQNTRICYLADLIKLGVYTSGKRNCWGYTNKLFHNSYTSQAERRSPTDSRKLYGAFYKQGFYLIPAWINNRMPSRVSEEINYPFPNLDGCTVVFWDWISDISPHFIMGVIIYPCWD